MLYPNLMQQFISHSDSIGGNSMPKFDKKSIKKLKEFLYNSYVHDAKLENVRYECGKDNIRIELFNPIFNVKIDWIFHNIGIMFAIKGNWYGSRETIIGLAVEDDFSYLQNCIPTQLEGAGDYLYLMFQMFSGDELHIVAKEVTIEITR